MKGNMLDRHIKDNEKVRKIWADLNKPWETVTDNISEAWKNVSWRKSCSFLSYYVFRIEPDVFAVDVLGGDDIVAYQQVLKSKNEDNAKAEADEVMAEFVARGFEVLSGFSIGMKRPHTELRFQQVFSDHGVLFGLSDDGLLYTYEKTIAGNDASWVLHNMKVKH